MCSNPLSITNKNQGDLIIITELKYFKKNVGVVTMIKVIPFSDSSLPNKGSRTVEAHAKSSQYNDEKWAHMP